MVESSDEMWSTREGYGKPLQYSYPENPMNSMKRQKKKYDTERWILRREGAQYANGEQWRNNSRNNEGTDQSENNTQFWMWLVMEVKSDAVRSNIA